MNQVMGLKMHTCYNLAQNFIGPVVQANSVPGADENDVITQSNVIDVTQNLQGTNDCDEANTGDNNAQCSNNISNNIDSITQSNLVDPITGTQVEDQSNLLGINQNLVATNDCDETGLGDNNANMHHYSKQQYRCYFTVKHCQFKRTYHKPGRTSNK